MSPIMTECADWRLLQAEYLKKNVYSVESPCYKRWLSQTPGYDRHHSDRTIELLRQACGTLKGLRVLDVGCGTGLDSVNIAREGAIVTGVDVDGDWLAVARARARAEGVNVTFVDNLADAGENGAPAFDAVISIDVIEHIEHPDEVYGPALARLRPGGAFVFCTPNRWALSCIWADPHWKLFGVSLMPRWLAKWYVCRFRKVIREYDMWYFLSRGWLIRLLERSGCRLVHDDVLAREKRLASPDTGSASVFRRQLFRLASPRALRRFAAWAYTKTFSRTWWMLAEKLP